MPPDRQKETLQRFARDIGASTRAVYKGPLHIDAAYDANISGLVSNIHQALQTATMVNMCKTATRNFWIAIIVSVIAFLSMLAAWVAVLFK